MIHFTTQPIDCRLCDGAGRIPYRPEETPSLCWQCDGSGNEPPPEPRGL